MSEPTACLKCGGSGTVACDTCQGTGMIVSYPGSSDAVMAGAIIQDYPCSVCDGSGSAPCPDCNRAL